MSTSISSARSSDTNSSIVTTTKATPLNSEKIPVWAIVLMVVGTLLLLVGVLCLALFIVQMRRKTGSQSTREKMISLSRRRLKTPPTISPSKAKESDLAKSPSFRTKTVASAMTAGNTPILPHKRSSMELRGKKGKNIREGNEALAIAKQKLFNNDEMKISPTETELRAKHFFEQVEESKDRLKAIDQFKLEKEEGKAKGKKTKKASSEKAAPSKIGYTRSAKSGKPKGQPSIIGKATEDEGSASATRSSSKSASKSHEISPKAVTLSSGVTGTTTGTESASPSDETQQKKALSLIRKGFLTAFKKSK